MDFKTVFFKLLTAFNEQQVRHALIGGMALGAWGAPRGTVDIDFLVHHEDMGKVDAVMKGLGYECRVSTQNVSQYVSPLQVFGEVDFLHALRAHSLGMLRRAGARKIFDGLVSVKVLEVEDLIGMKVQAMANNKDRAVSDLADIEALLAVHGHTADWSLIGEYFGLFEFNDLLEELQRKYGPVK